MCLRPGSHLHLPSPSLYRITRGSSSTTTLPNSNSSRQFSSSNTNMSQLHPLGPEVETSTTTNDLKRQLELKQLELSIQEQLLQLELSTCASRGQYHEQIRDIEQKERDLKFNKQEFESQQQRDNAILRKKQLEFEAEHQQRIQEFELRCAAREEELARKEKAFQNMVEQAKLAQQQLQEEPKQLAVVTEDQFHDFFQTTFGMDSDNNLICNETIINQIKDFITQHVAKASQQISKQAQQLKKASIQVQQVHDDARHIQNQIDIERNDLYNESEKITNERCQLTLDSIRFQNSKAIETKKLEDEKNVTISKLALTSRFMNSSDNGDFLSFCLRQPKHILEIIKGLQLSGDELDTFFTLNPTQIENKYPMNRITLCIDLGLDSIESNLLCSLTNDEFQSRIADKYSLAIQTHVIQKCKSNKKFYQGVEASIRFELYVPAIDKRIHVEAPPYALLIDVLFGDGFSTVHTCPHTLAKLESPSIFTALWLDLYNNGQVPRLNQIRRLFFSTPTIAGGQWIQFYGSDGDRLRMDQSSVSIGSLCPASQPGIFRSFGHLDQAAVDCYLDFPLADEIDYNPREGYGDAMAVSQYQISIKWDKNTSFGGLSKPPKRKTLDED